ncbi:MAG: DinB family protein [Cytophagales bacterium]|nr:DinB family protein [Bernardetiaceae bacterium]MDW8203537.1 DinB family protein [Cytophagales bacterium]
MTKLELVKQAYNRLHNHIYKSFDKIVAAMPSDKLDMKPSPENMSFKQIALHVYQTALMVGNAIKTGQMDKADTQLIPLVPEELNTAAKIVAYGNQVKAQLTQVIEHMSEADAEKPIITTFGITMNPLRLLYVLQEEAIHHRGQLTICLRMVGIKPPSIYDYS